VNELTKIKALFTPSQPTVKNSGEDVAYHEISPNVKLINHIYCYWQLESIKPLSEPFFYRAVADGCIDIITECNRPYDSRIMGFSTTYKIFPLGESFNYIGIRFLPTAFPSIFGINVSELSNRVEELRTVLPKVSEQIGHIVYNNPVLKVLKESLDCYFLKLFCNLSNNHDKRLHSAVNIILNSHGNLATERDLDVGLSPRQLRRLFEFYLGAGPKVFSKVVRFQSLLNVNPSNGILRKNKLFYDFGYYDQAHFIKDFKAFYGLSPTIAFK
jgi:AraC-like DNA-binding protein